MSGSRLLSASSRIIYPIGAVQQGPGVGGAAHGRLWDALRKKGRQVRVIGIAVENQTVDRTVRVLRAWVAAPAKGRPEKVTEGVSIDDYSTWFAERFAVAGQDL